MTLEDEWRAFRAGAIPRCACTGSLALSVVQEQCYYEFRCCACGWRSARFRADGDDLRVVLMDFDGNDEDTVRRPRA